MYLYQIFEQIYLFVRRLGHDRQMSEDLTQETFLHAWQHIGQLRNGRALGGWLYRIAANLAKSHWRTKNSSEQGILDEANVAAVKHQLDSSDLEHPDVLSKSVSRLPMKFRQVVVLQGRFHLYEGHPVEKLALPVRAARLLGCETFVVTNAAGGVNPDYAAGDIVLLSDHINMMLVNPLIGPNVDEFGPRFPGMVGAYDPALRELAREVAAEQGVELREGVYTGLSGPTFETPAEVRMLRGLGTDVVGMSTVPLQ